MKTLLRETLAMFNQVFNYKGSVACPPKKPTLVDDLYI